MYLASFLSLNSPTGSTDEANFRNTFNTGASTRTDSRGCDCYDAESRVDGSIEERALPYTIVAKNS